MPAKNFDMWRAATWWDKQGSSLPELAQLLPQIPLPIFHPILFLYLSLSTGCDVFARYHHQLVSISHFLFSSLPSSILSIINPT